MKNLKTIRQRRGLTQVQLAALVRVDQSMIAAWELGTKWPRSDRLPDLARALSCSIDELYDDAEKAG